MSISSSLRFVPYLWRTGSAVAALAFAMNACAPITGAPAVATAPAAIAPVATTVTGPAGPTRSAPGPLPVPPNLLALTQAAGQSRLMSTADKQSYWPLSEYFETQRNEAYCSVASSVMALNALGIKRPPSSQYPDFPYFSQEDFFRSVDPSVANPARVAREGMTLDQLASVLSEFPVSVTKYHSGDLSLAQFRAIVRRTTAQADGFALLNFRRAEIGEKGGGHWSPLAAFDAASDSALVLDVARYKYPAVWVPIRRLYAASQAVDNVSGVSRGVLIIRKR